MGELRPRLHPGLRPPRAAGFRREDLSVIGYCFGGVLSLLYGSIFNDGR